MAASRTSTARATRERRAPRGLTLLEVVTVLALVGLVAALAMPRLATRTGDVAAAADELAGRLTAARWRALVDGREVTVPLRARGPGLRVEVAGARSTDASAGAPALALGPVPAALPVTITLTGPADERARIVVPPGLGPVEVRYEASP